MARLSGGYNNMVFNNGIKSWSTIRPDTDWARLVDVTKIVNTTSNRQPDEFYFFAESQFRCQSKQHA